MITENTNTDIKVLILVQNQFGEFLLIKEKIEAHPEPRWNFIRGSCDKPGEVIIDTAKRECLEEIGIQNFEKFELSRVQEFNTDDKKRIYHIFGAKTHEQPQIQNSGFQENLGENILSAQWTPLKEIQNMEELDFIDPIIHTIAQSLKT